MPEADRHKIAETLHRYSSRIAGNATAALAPHISELRSGKEALAREDRTAAGVPGGIVTTDLLPEGHSDLLAMAEDGFRRLGSIVAFSVLVDEPGLITTDLLWLQTMLASRGMDKGNFLWVPLLVRTYVAACQSALNSQDFQVVENVVERALERLDLSGEHHQ